MVWKVVILVYKCRLSLPMIATELVSSRKYVAEKSFWTGCVQILPALTVEWYSVNFAVHTATGGRN